MISCKVEERLFHGNSVRLRCRLATGGVLLCDRQLNASRDLAALPDAGGTVHFAVDPDSIALFQEESQ